MKKDEAFPSTWMKADDFPTPEVLTVTGVKTVTVGQGAEADDRRVATFEETSGELILNVTNWKALAKISGQDDDDNWRGTRVEVFRTMVEYKGEPIPALRLRPPGGWEKWLEEQGELSTPNTSTGSSPESDDLPF